VVEDCLVPPGSHPLACLRLDHSFDVNVNVNTGVEYLFLPVAPPPRPSYLRSLLLSACGPDILLAAIPACSSSYSHSALEVREAPGRDGGHETTSRLGQAHSEHGRTADRGKCQEGNEHMGRHAICHAIFELEGAGSLVSDGRGEGGGEWKGSLGRQRAGRTLGQKNGTDGHREQG
jgi:hypothetical protein